MPIFLKDVEKQTLLDRYFDIEWCDDVSDLRCVRCHRVAISHCVSSCQHIFCRTCSQLYGDGDQQSNCPQCQDHITQPDDQELDFEVKIHRLKLFCPSKKIGCKYSGQLWTIPAHLMTCAYTREAALQGKSQDDAQLTIVGKLTEVNSKVEEKLTELETKTDNTDRKFKQLERKTDDICRRFNEMTERMKSLDKKIEDTNVGIDSASKTHLKNLQKTLSLLESVNQTVQNNESLLLGKVENMRTKTDSMTKDIDALQYKKSVALNCLQATYEWTMKDVKKTTAEVNWRLESEEFMFTGYKHVIRAKLEKEDGLVRIYLHFRDDVTTRQSKPKYEFTSVQYVVRDQRNDKNRKDIVIEADLTFDEGYGRYNWIFRKRLPDEIMSPPYMTDDCVKISIILKPPSIDRSFVSNNGVVLWRVDNYKAKMQEWYHYGVCSPTFYTSPRGHRVKAQLLIDHKGFLSLRVLFLTGDHDFMLFQDFHHATTVTLYNRVDPSKTLVKIKKMNEAECYTVPFEISAIVEQNDFISHDSLLLKIVIESEDGELTDE